MNRRQLFAGALALTPAPLLARCRYGAARRFRRALELGALQIVMLSYTREVATTFVVSDAFYIVNTPSGWIFGLNETVSADVLSTRRATHYELRDYYGGHLLRYPLPVRRHYTLGDTIIYQPNKLFEVKYA